ncbi:hypothetical protein VNO77_23485 [Canavalia gladiata]|uniref:Uncharacterized protein n=1 Tax=Canavalia gladiata TaxID=3824 RepID=A0AAN9QBR2_CANGL
MFMLCCYFTLTLFLVLGLDSGAPGLANGIADLLCLVNPLLWQIKSSPADNDDSPDAAHNNFDVLGD